MKIKYLTYIATLALLAVACVNKPKQVEEQPQPKLILSLIHI